MKKSEIIHIMKDPIQKVMDRFEKGKIHPAFPSHAIAYALYLYDKKITNDSVIRDNNNPVGLQNPSTAEFLSFNTMEECLLEFCNRKEVNEEFTNIYDSICKAFNLYRFDKQILQSKEGNIIDIPEEKRDPKIVLYTVKDETGNVIGTASTKIDADKLAAGVMNNKKVIITNSRNKIINGTKVVAGTTNMITTAITPGSMIVCDGMNLYYKAKDTRPGRVIDGEYYIYDGKNVNGRYAICMKPEFAAKVPTAIIGYINIKDIKK